MRRYLEAFGAPSQGERLGLAPAEERAAVRRRLHPDRLREAGLAEGDVYRLYRALRVYSLGFHEMTAEVLSKITHTDARRALLWDVWRFYAWLWEASLSGKGAVQVEHIRLTLGC